MLFRPNTTCLIQRVGGEPNVYGAFTYAAATTVPCAVITYDLGTHKSSVRADSSGSRGRAFELSGMARFLFPVSVAIKRGDIVTKDGYTLKVIEIHQRRAVDGRHDHNEVDFERAEPVA